MQDLGTIFAMFDEDNSGAISLSEWETVTGALQARLKRVSPVHRTGARLHTGCAPAPTACAARVLTLGMHVPKRMAVTPLVHTMHDASVCVLSIPTIELARWCL